MDKQLKSYGTLCSIFYDAVKKFAPEREVDFYSAFIEKNSAPEQPLEQHRVLELMSGSGRLQIPLAQRGYVVDGVDNSKIMLDRCQKRAQELGLSLDVYEQSLQELDLPHTYATATIAVGSFQLLTKYEDALSALKKIHKHMQSGGHLLIDIFVPDLLSEPRSVRTVRIDANSVIRLTTRHIFDEQQRLADAYCFYELIVNGQVVQQEDELIQVTWRTDAEWKALLEETGFRVLKIAEESFRSSGSSRVLVAQAV